MTANSNKEASPTREQTKNEQHRQNEQTREKRKRIKVRLFPIWLRVMIVAVLIVLSILLGAIVGYSVMGDGNAADVFKKSTWTHIVDLVNKEKG